MKSKNVKEIPETFDEVWTLSKKLRSEKISFCTGDMYIKGRDNITFRLSHITSGFIEYKTIDKTGVVVADLTPEQMWDFINSMIESKESRIKKLEEKKFELLRQGTDAWCIGQHSEAEDLFINGCKVIKEIEELKKL